MQSTQYCLQGFHSTLFTNYVAFIVISPHIHPSVHPCLKLLPLVLLFIFPFIFHLFLFFFFSQDAHGANRQQVRPASLCTHLLIINRVTGTAQFSTKRTTDLKKQKRAAVLAINTCDRLHKFYCTQK